MIVSELRQKSILILTYGQATGKIRKQPDIRGTKGNLTRQESRANHWSLTGPS